VAQGAYQAMVPFNTNLRMFYRKTMQEFKDQIDQFDIIINGIEVSKGDDFIIDKEHFMRIKENALIIDAAADAGNAIYGTRFTYHDMPIINIEGVNYYCITNSPSIFYRT